jgi:putative FmdB family regulatory protein
MSPTYEYRCDKCNTNEDYVFPINKGGDVVCQKCGATMWRAYAVPSVVFRGGGWAKNDRVKEGKNDNTKD